MQELKFEHIFQSHKRAQPGHRFNFGSAKQAVRGLEEVRNGLKSSNLNM
jgi:hypothetical protein